MANNPNRGKGKCVTFLREAATQNGDDCVTWPFCTNGLGYGVFGYLGEHHYAHRFVCELAHGPAPADKPQAAHSCGNGNKGCVNPRHLSWKSNSENQLDRREHGTQRKLGGYGPRLTAEQIAQVRALKDELTLAQLADRFGVKRGCIEYWLRHDRPLQRPGGSRGQRYRRLKFEREGLIAASNPQEEVT